MQFFYFKECWQNLHPNVLKERVWLHVVCTLGRYRAIAVKYKMLTINIITASLSFGRWAEASPTPLKFIFDCLQESCQHVRSFCWMWGHAMIGWFYFGEMPLQVTTAEHWQQWQWHYHSQNSIIGKGAKANTSNNKKDKDSNSELNRYQGQPRWQHQ